MATNHPNNAPDYEYDDYEHYPDAEVTSLGLPPGQLALIIGVNAVISLIISVVVVLVANRQVIPGDVATPVGGATSATTVSGQVVSVATGTPGESPAAQPESTRVESVVYTVSAGDTLGQIASRFSVSLFDLMLANGLTNEDFIQVGQELIIPLGGTINATPTFTPIPLLTETPLPFDPPTPISNDETLPQEAAATVGPSPTLPLTAPTTGETGGTPTPIPTFTPAAFDEINVVISEVTGAGELSQETLTILNKGASTSLLNWQLEGSPLGNFVFPDIFLFSGGSIRIHTSAGQNTPSDLYLGQGESAWPPDATITLTDADGAEISVYNP